MEFRKQARRYTKMSGGWRITSWLRCVDRKVFGQVSRARFRFRESHGRATEKSARSNGRLQLGFDFIQVQIRASFKAVDMYNEIAKESGMSLIELSLRWAKDNRANTTSLVGHTSLNQLKETAKIFRRERP